MKRETQQFHISLPGNIDVFGEFTQDSPRDRVIILCHGFGVSRYSLGLFEDIADLLAKYATVILFDFFKMSQNGTEALISTYPTQVDMLKAVYEYAQTTFHTSSINAIAHSQGCFITALAKLPFQKTIQLAFPLTIPYDRLVRKFGLRPGARLNFYGNSYMPQTEGIMSIIPKECWEDYKKLSPYVIFTQMPNLESIVYVTALNDEKLMGIDYSSFKTVDGIKYTEIAGDHNFTGEYRKGVLDYLQSVFVG